MTKRLKVVLCWHFHQQVYREPLSHEYRQPWTYLHAIKDYVDMIAYLEANSLARVVVNVTPLLLEQINDYCQQIDDYCLNKADVRDPLLAALGNTILALRAEQQQAFIKQCSCANHKNKICRFPKYQYLVEIAETERKHLLVVELSHKALSMRN